MQGTGYKLVFIVLSTALIVLYLSGSTVKTILNLKEEVDYYETKLADIRSKNSFMKKEFEWLNSYPDYVKYLARKKLGLVEPGETKIYIKGNSAKDQDLD